MNVQGQSQAPYFSKNPADDPGDKFDPLPWDLSESSMYKYIVNGKLYKIKSDSNTQQGLNALNLLVHTRNEIYRLCMEIHRNLKSGQAPKDRELLDFINLFLDIHCEHCGSRGYLLSEIPNGSVFEGLNKPKGRYITREKNIGTDYNLRASYRDVFLRTNMSLHDYKLLVVHELSHTGCNHVRWRDDDHGPDFKKMEKFLLKMAKNIKFLE